MPSIFPASKIGEAKVDWMRLRMRMRMPQVLPLQMWMPQVWMLRVWMLRVRVLQMPMPQM
ncbi:hypothetical protein [Thioalkalivibrio sp. HK1]|uniref:hypothetical protein n=1 Tax=Thioalkalivibrio sp. HK1 TaxID=1469245 RepID=UPI001E56AB3C|nr:hypothetical protein [Thioalkalivibrio sp. HK1]